MEEIGEACLQIDASLNAVADEAVHLTEYAWAFRYPGDPVTPKLEEAQAALVLAKRAYETVLKLVPAEAHP